jgi:hypothetical protein
VQRVLQLIFNTKTVGFGVPSFWGTLIGHKEREPGRSRMNSIHAAISLFFRKDMCLSGKCMQMYFWCIFGSKYIKYVVWGVSLNFDGHCFLSSKSPEYKREGTLGFPLINLSGQTRAAQSFCLPRLSLPCFKGCSKNHPYNANRTLNLRLKGTLGMDSWNLGEIQLLDFWTNRART